MSTDSREARIEAEAVTDEEVEAAALSLRATCGDDWWFSAVRRALEAAQEASGPFCVACNKGGVCGRRERHPYHDTSENPSVSTQTSHEFIAGKPLEAARKARASNDSGGSELCYGGGLALPHRVFRDPRAAPQPAPDRVSRIERLERFASTLAAGVGHGVEAWNSALIAAAKAWNREGE